MTCLHQSTIDRIRCWRYFPFQESMHHYNQSFLFLPVQESERPSRLLPEILASIYMRHNSFGSMWLGYCLIQNIFTWLASIPNPSSLLANQSSISVLLIMGSGYWWRASSFGELVQSTLPPLKVILTFGLPISSAAIPAICQKSAFEMAWNKQWSSNLNRTDIIWYNRNFNNGSSSSP